MEIDDIKNFISPFIFKGNLIATSSNYNKYSFGNNDGSCFITEIYKNMCVGKNVIEAVNNSRNILFENQHPYFENHLIPETNYTLGTINIDDFISQKY